MTTPTRPGQPVLMFCLQRVYQAAWSGRLPDVMPGGVFWARFADSQGLIDGGFARLWMPGDPPAPPPEPPNTVHGIAGIGAGARNSSPGLNLPHYAGPPPASRQN